METLYADRAEAGRVLARRLARFAGRQDAVVLALPRGGVPVGYEVARALGLPLDVFVVRKLGTPWQPELAMGAVASGGVRVLNPSVVRALGIPREVIDAETRRELDELARRERAYRADGGAGEPLDVRGKTVLLVDDGLATGSTMRAAVAALRESGPPPPARIVVAVPVAAPEVCEEFTALADEVECAATPRDFFSVGSWYEDFRQTTDAEVRELLARSREEARSSGGASPERGHRAQIVERPERVG